ncbi:hypothetical protein ABS642_20045 [Microbacterium sp. A8/3-1]|uniref:DUF2964 family protein n=1 Tax=Microbacterium sp. A8/3-1 TaxID=3160749 RepID=A0AAU7VUT3_9MICO
MMLERRWALVLGAILMMNALFILLRSDGRIESFVGGGICAFGGILIIVVTLLRPTLPAQRDNDETPHERSGE